ncbi:hypothetical protein RQP46_008749 [Phenoliferia psychrophenolica]
MVPDSDASSSTPQITLAAPSPSAAPPAASRHSKPATKTYTRRVPLEPVAEPASADTVPPSPTGPSPAVTVAAHPRSSSAAILIPETDSDLGNLESEEEREGSDGERDVASTRRRSDADARHRRDSSASVLTTDPTSEDEPANKTIRPRAAESDSDSSDGDANDDDDAPIFKRKSVAEEMAEIEARYEADDAAGPPLMHLGLPAPAAATGPSSPLTSLIDSSVQFASSTQPSLSSPPHQHLPQRHLPASTEDSDDEESVKPVFARRKTRIVASDSSDHDDDAMNGHESETSITDAQRPPPSYRSRSAAVVASSDVESDASKPAEPERPLTKRERVEALAAKKRPAPVKEKEDEGETSRTASGVSGVDSSDEDSAKKVKKPRTSKKGLTKKGEDATHREAAALQRGQYTRLQPRTKQQVSVSSVVSKSSKSFVVAPTHVSRPLINLLPLSSATTFSSGVRASSAVPRPSAAAPSVTIHSSSSAIEDDSSSQPSNRHTSHAPSAKALGKQQQQRRVVRLPTASTSAAPSKKVEKAPESDSDDEFLPVDVLLANKAKKEAALLAEKEKKDALARFHAQKLAAARSADPSAADSDSDSDFEILPDPNRPPPATPSATPFDVTHLSSTARKFDELTAHHAHHHDEDASESQIVNAARLFGADLSAPAHASLKLRTVIPPPPGASSSSKPARKSRGNIEVRIDQDALNVSLMHKAQAQNIATTTKKRVQHRAQADAKARADVAAKVDVASLLANKAEKLQGGGEQIEQEEEEDDPDYAAGEDVGESDEEMAEGSGSEEEEQASGVEEEEEEEVRREETPQAEMLPPPPPPKAAVEVVPMELDDDGDFSDFFGTAFDAEVGQGPQASGFAGFQQQSQADALFVNALIDSREQGRDGDGLRQELGVLDTPAVAKPQFQQYINSKGMYTQTVQDTANLFEGSPSDTPRHLSSHAPSVPGTDTTVNESQTLSQTQLDAQTPTQAPRNGKTLFRAQNLFPYAAVPAPEVEVDADDDVEPTVPTHSPSSPETQDTEVDVPSAAQPVRNAFDVLAMGARAAVAPSPPAEERKKKASKNMFVHDEVEMDEEETAMMGGGNDSGDEDEAGMDAELESLVDNEEKDRELVAEEDERVEELRAQHEAAKEAAAEARAKAITEGKERLKRKNGGMDLSDDDFDDDGYGVAKKGDKRPRVENKTMADLEANEETQSFVAPLKEGLVVPIKADDLSFLTLAEESDRSDDEENDGYAASSGDEYAREDREDGSVGPSPEPKPKQKVYRSMKARKEEERRIIEESKLGRERSPSPRLYTGESSSPAPKIKIKKKSAVAAREGSPDVDSQYSLTRKYSTVDGWKADSKEDSQGAANSGKSGKSSAVTSFKTENSRAKAAYGGSLVAGSHGKTDVVPRQSKFAAFRKNGIAPKASTKSAPGARQSNPRASKVKPGAYAEHHAGDDEDGDEMEDGEEDGTQEPDDLMSTLDLAAVMKAFANKGARKEQDDGKLVEKDLAALLEKTQATVDGIFKTELGKCDSFIKNLKLDNATVNGTDERTIRLQFEDQQRERSSIMAQVDEVADGLRPANNTLYTEAVATLSNRRGLSKKSNKRFQRFVRDQASDQNEIMQMTFRQLKTL